MARDHKHAERARRAGKEMARDLEHAERAGGKGQRGRNQERARRARGPTKG
jgi:hypothetical protein